MDGCADPMMEFSKIEFPNDEVFYMYRGQYCKTICLDCGRADVPIERSICDCGGLVPMVRHANPMAVLREMKRLEDPDERAKERAKIDGHATVANQSKIMPCSESSWHSKPPML